MSYYNYYDDWNEEGKCVICEKPTQCLEHDYCYECFCAIKDYKDQCYSLSYKKIIKKYNQLLDNAKKDINNINIIELQRELHALAQYEEETYHSDIMPFLDDDINEILKLKNKKDFAKNFRENDLRQEWPKEFQCDDGHYVRSPYELIIDNWLYHHDYQHEYEKSVFMKSAPDEIILSDFYLPKQNVYIEFWGIENDEKYKKRKEQKIKLYEENNLNRIDLNKNDIKRLNDILPRLLQK